MDKDEAGSAARVFADNRDLLFGVAYRILGRAADAEDVVQEAWLRWNRVDPARVDNATGFLVRTAARLAVDRLRREQRSRESYVGPWLPEPVLTAPDSAEEVERRESVSIGLLVVLETLSPLERAVFVLREAFAFSHAEIGAMLGRSESAVRQLAHRARSHVQARRPRFESDRSRHREITERFMAACAGGDLTALMELLAPEVELTGDSGGLARGPRRVITGADKVGRFLLGITTQAPPDAEVRLVEVNRAPAILVVSEGRPFAVFAVEVEQGRIRDVWMWSNPEKLTAVEEAARLGGEPPPRTDESTM